MHASRAGEQHVSGSDGTESRKTAENDDAQHGDARERGLRQDFGAGDERRAVDGNQNSQRTGYPRNVILDHVLRDRYRDEEKGRRGEQDESEDGTGDDAGLRRASSRVVLKAEVVSSQHAEGEPRGGGARLAADTE